jgi:squalene-hopene/tetraprenyl-beta-curcumene cyclase
MTSFNKLRPPADHTLKACTYLLAAFLFSNTCTAQDTWDPLKAVEYLDARISTWASWSGASRGNATTCVSCHTGVPYAMARRVAGLAANETSPGAAETTFHENVTRRTLGDSDNLYYDFKVSQSKGTEAVINALALALRDQSAGVTDLPEDTQKAFEQLWSQQETTGNKKGSWDWLTFSLEPWESTNARYYGAALAALAVGATPQTFRDSDGVPHRIAMTRDYLTSSFSSQPLHGQLFAVLAHHALGDILSTSHRMDLQERVFDRQNADGGWSLSSLGDWDRSDGTPQSTESDGYATGLVVLTMLRSGVPSADQRLRKGIDWLSSSQLPDGRWPASSVNKTREGNSHIGKFMYDAATAFAVLVLTQAD